jgi:hypothetical protein
MLFKIEVSMEIPMMKCRPAKKHKIKFLPEVYAAAGCLIGWSFNVILTIEAWIRMTSSWITPACNSALFLTIFFLILKNSKEYESETKRMAWMHDDVSEISRH